MYKLAQIRVTSVGGFDIGDGFVKYKGIEVSLLNLNEIKIDINALNKNSIQKINIKSEINHNTKSEKDIETNNNIKIDNISASEKLAEYIQEGYELSIYYCEFKNGGKLIYAIETDGIVNFDSEAIESIEKEQEKARKALKIAWIASLITTPIIIGIVTLALMQEYISLNKERRKIINKANLLATLK